MHEDSPDVAFPVGPAIVVALSKREGRWGRRYIFTPLRPHGANLATKRRASIWDLGHAPCLQRGMKERESSTMPRTMAPWSIDESFPILVFEDNRDPTSVMYQQFIQRFSVLLSLPFSSLSSNWQGGKGGDSEIRAVKFEYDLSTFNSSVESKWEICVGRGIFEYILGDCTIALRPSHTTFHQLLFTSKGLIVTHRD